ncbi:MAG: hypothetical protein ACRCYO_03875 [Bacteroidia bacterium]
MKNKIALLAVAGFFATTSVSAQVLTKEDSLAAGLIARNVATVLSGYGEAKVEYNLDAKTGVADLTRNVLFLGHKFNSRIQLFSEFEVEHARVEGNIPGGEVSMEQLFIKFAINRDAYLVTGLFIPRIGIINENHLPTTFNGNDRPVVENLLIPATWRELGVSVYGQIRKLPGFNYSFGLVNGLNSAGFGNGRGIRGGRYRGSYASASNLALTGSALYYVGAFRLQASGYFGGSVGLPTAIADTMNLNAGAFGTPVILGEVNAQYFDHGFSAKFLACYIAIPDANDLNREYNRNVGESSWGAYAELGYNILRPFGVEEKTLTLFARYEMLDLHATVPENGTRDNTLNRQYLITGLTWQPVRGVSAKLDFKQIVTGTPTGNTNFDDTKNYINLGVAYSF